MNNNHANLVLALALLVSSLLAQFDSTVNASADFLGDAIEVANLKDQLEKGLKARRPEEFKFIGHVVVLVEDNRLPLDLVISTFRWALKKAKVKQYPYPFFEHALRERAAELGVSIP